MNLTHFVPQIEEQSGGYSYTVPRTCEALFDACHSVRLVTVDGKVRVYDGSSGDERRKFTERKGSQIESQKSLERQLGVSARLKRVVFECAANSDVLHAHSLWRMTNVYPALAAKKYKIPFVVSPRGTLSQQARSSRSLTKSAFNFLLQRNALSTASLIHVTSENEYCDVRANGYRTPVALIPNGVDIPEMLSKKKDNKRVALFVGRIHPIKGLELLLECWRNLEKQFEDWEIRIVGPIDGEYARSLKKKTEKERILRVVFFGEQSGANLISEFQTADIVVLPSYSENFGMVVAEALANETPVITTTGTPWSELKNKGCGWWVDRNLGVFQCAMQEAMNTSRHDLQEMGIRGRIWMTNDYAWDRIAQNFIATYKWLLSNSERPEFIILD